MTRDIKGSVRLVRRAALALGAAVALAVPAGVAGAEDASVVNITTETGQAAQLQCERLDVVITHSDSNLVVQNGHDHRVENEGVSLKRYSGSHTQKFRQCRLPGHEGYVYVSRHLTQCLEASARKGDRLRAVQCTAGGLQRFMKFYDDHRAGDLVQLSSVFSRGDHCVGPRDRDVIRGTLLTTQDCAEWRDNEDQLFEVRTAR